jgi:hypothetical protein
MRCEGQMEKEVQNICLQLQSLGQNNTGSILSYARILKLFTKPGPSPQQTFLFQVSELLRTNNIVVGYLRDRCWQHRHEILIWQLIRSTESQCRSYLSLYFPFVSSFLFPVPHQCQTHSTANTFASFG